MPQVHPAHEAVLKINPLGQVLVLVASWWRPDDLRLGRDPHLPRSLARTGNAQAPVGSRRWGQRRQVGLPTRATR